jgi:ABC-2 type transport system permease protein
MQLHSQPLDKPGWMRELIAIWGYAQRNYYLTKRYFLWELVWLTYTIMNALTIGFIGVGFGGAAEEVARTTTFLLIGSMVWSYLSMIFDLLSETVSWERWEGTIEYTFMSPASRITQLLGMGIYAIFYGMIRVVIMLIAISFFFDLSLGQANYAGAAGILAICSVSLVGFGMVAAVMPLLSPEKGQQVLASSPPYCCWYRVSITASMYCRGGYNHSRWYHRSPTRWTAFVPRCWMARPSAVNGTTSGHC